MAETWNEENIKETEKSEGSWNEDGQLPEGSGAILGEDQQEAKEENENRQEIGEDMVDQVIGGLAKTNSTSTSNSNRKKKRDDILLPEL